MKFQKLTLFLILCLSLFVVSFVCGQTKTNENQKKGMVVGYATQNIFDEVSESALPPSDRKRIKAKKKRYDLPNDLINTRFDRDLTKLPSGGGRGAGCESPQPSSIPVEQSTAIIVGKIIKAQTHLTESKTAIFTEFDFEIEDVLKTNNSSVTPRNSIRIDGEAGALRLADGKVIRYEGSCVSKLPQQGRRYLLFLKPIHDGQDITIIVGYELQDGKVFPLSESYVYTPQTKKITKVLPFTNTDEVQFIQIVRDAIANPKSQTNNN